jgi:sialic acid synthase SpsE
MAAKKGARIIEVHITQNKNEGFIDNNVRFDLTELYKIAKEIRIK